MNQTEKSEDYKKKESETALIKSKPKKQLPSSKAKSASTRLSNDLPKNLLSVNQVVNNKGELSGQLLVKAICRVPDDWLLKNKRPLLHGREVLQAVLATWQSRAKELPC